MPILFDKTMKQGNAERSGSYRIRETNERAKWELDPKLVNMLQALRERRLHVVFIC